MNSKHTLKNQDLFSFCFSDQDFINPNQFKIALPSNYVEGAKTMLAESKDHSLNPEVYGEMQLNIDIGINMFFFCFIKVMSYQKRTDFLNYQYQTCKPENRLTFLYRVESLAGYNYWYAFGENSYYNPDTEKEVMDWVIEKYLGVNNKKSPIILLK